MVSMEDMQKTTVGCTEATTSPHNTRWPSPQPPYIIYGLFQEHMRCVVDLKDWNPPFKHIFDNMTADQTEQIHKENRDNAPVTGYYQWVTFVMAIQAAIFYFPHKVTF